jgi:hypothetical protein
MNLVAMAIFRSAIGGLARAIAGAEPLDTPSGNGGFMR